MRSWHETGVPRTEVREWLASVIGSGPDVITAMQQRINDLEKERDELVSEVIFLQDQLGFIETTKGGE